MTQPPSFRPLSPHLQVWKWTLTMALSIFHRASGCALAAGTVVLVWWLVAAVGGAGTYDSFISCVKSPLGQLALLGWTAAYYYHLCSGLRHLVMDTGRLLTVKSSDKVAVMIFLATFALTLGTWAYLKDWI